MFALGLRWWILGCLVDGRWWRRCHRVAPTCFRLLGWPPPPLPFVAVSVVRAGRAATNPNHG
jgi:hypothetical protein